MRNTTIVFTHVRSRSGGTRAPLSSISVIARMTFHFSLAAHRSQAARLQCEGAHMSRSVCSVQHVESMESRVLLAGDGLTAIYFDNENLTGTSVVRVDPTVNFSWGSGSPDAAIQSNTFSARWGGEVEAVESGTYTFRSTADDGASLWVDGQRIINKFTGGSSNTPYTGTISLTAGNRYHIMYEYRESFAGAGAKLEWQRPGQSSFEVVPQARLYSMRSAVPASAGLINVKTSYGAVGDGVADDWWAIQRAISDSLGNQTLIYLPAGTYRISKPIFWRKFNSDQTPNTGATNSGWGAWVGLKGEQRDATVIRFDNNAFTAAPSYTSGNFTPNAVIYTASADDSNVYDNVTGPGNQAFYNSVFDLTVNTGSGNTGAVGIDYQVSNFGEIRNVTVRSEDGAGNTGIRMDRKDNGPGLVTNVSILGYQTGLSMSGSVDAVTIKGLTMVGQGTVGISTGSATIAVRQLTSVNSVKAFDVGSQGHLTLVDSALTGGASGSTAITSTTQGLLVRDVSVSGYGTSISSTVGGTTTTRTGNVSQFSSTADIARFTPASNSRRVTPQEAVRYSDADTSNWVFAANVSGDDTASIQNALNTAVAQGKDTIYLSNSAYELRDTIVIPNGIRRIVGFYTAFNAGGTNFDNASSPRPYFRVDATGANPVVIERVRLNSSASGKDGAYGVQHNGSAPLVLKLAMLEGDKGVYKAGLSAGALFTESAVGSGWQFRSGQNAYLVQLNTEGKNEHVTAPGANLYILGMKTEDSGRVINMTGNGRLELLGGFFYGSGTQPNSTNAAITLVDSLATLSFRTVAFDPAKDFPVYVSEKRGTDTRTLLRTVAPSSGSSRFVSLYT
jgi:hypothetical protein